jgi:subtilisin family serine protease
MSEHELPAWDVPRDATSKIALQSSWPAAITRDWAFGDSTGKGARVCILDSGVELGDPLVGEVQSAVVVTAGEDGEPRIDEDAEGDVCGHGTACAGIVRALAPEAEIHSVRVLGPGYTGSGKILLAGLRHAIEQRFDIVNMSLSTTKKDHAAVLHQLADAAYFKRMVLVASAVAWLGGETIRCTGNSFATPHVAGICALVRSKHPALTPFELKSLLHLTSRNVADRR